MPIDRRNRRHHQRMAEHLTASMRVLRSHLHRPSVTVNEAHDDVKALALRLGTGLATADDLALEEKLRKATGVHVAVLAGFAEDWPTEEGTALAPAPRQSTKERSMASNQPHTKRDTGGQADKTKDSANKTKAQPPASKSTQGKGARKK